LEPSLIMAKIKELSLRDSVELVKGLMKRKRSIDKNELKPGHLFFTHYNAKNKEQTYDKTPLVLVLRRNASHTLGLNFHWIPMSMRINLVKHIMEINKTRIKHRKSLIFNYRQLKPMLKSLGYAPCIRLYINKRFSKQGVIIPPHRLMDIARTKSETFTRGRYSAGQLFAMARRAGKTRNKRKH